MTLRHVVLFRLHDDVPAERRDEALRQLRALGDGPGILEWHIELSLDERKGTVIVEDATFESAQALQTYRDSPAHRETVALMAQIADWLVGDYER